MSNIFLWHLLTFVNVNKNVCSCSFTALTMRTDTTFYFNNALVKVEIKMN